MNNNAKLAGEFFYLGLEKFKSNLLFEAEIYFKKSLELLPDRISTITNYSAVLIKMGQLDLAKEIIDHAIKKFSDDEYLFLNLSQIFELKKDYLSALNYLNKSIQINPNYYEAYSNRGNIFHEMKLTKDAIENFNYAIKLNPDYADAYLNLGMVYLKKDNIQVAIQNFDRAIELVPNSAEAISNRGVCFQRQGLFDTAALYFKKATELKPDYAEAYSNLGLVLGVLNKTEDAILNFNKAIEIKPDYVRAIHNKSLTLLSKSLFKEGWDIYESRWAQDEPPLEAFITQKPIVKNLHEVLNKKILIWHEQGIGDFVMFSGLLEEMAALSPDIQILVDPRFLSLYKRSMPHLKFLDKGLAESKIDFDVHMPIGDLGKYFRNSIKDFDLNRKGYLISDSNKTKQIKDGLAKNKKYICGLSWKSKREKLGKSKSIDLTDLLPILKNKNITFVSLQYGDVAEELRSLSQNHGVYIHENITIDNFNDLDGHASLIDACDFVITVSSSTAHIAGALGKETYLLLPLGFAAVWYWSNKLDNKSIWYPSISIFQKTIVNDWEAPVQSINNILNEK